MTASFSGMKRVALRGRIELGMMLIQLLKSLAPIKVSIMLLNCSGVDMGGGDGGFGCWWGGDRCRFRWRGAGDGDGEGEDEMVRMVRKIMRDRR